MNFYDFTTIYSIIKRQGLADKPPVEWYDLELKRTMDEAIAMAERHSGEAGLTPVIGNMQMSCERDWEVAGRPYYKVFPDLLPYFVDTKLDVPAEFFRLPFPAFVIRLPDKHQVDALKISDQHYVRSILVGGCEKGTPALLFGPNSCQEVDDHRQVIIFIDINELEGEYQIPVLTYQQLLFENDKQTAEESLRKQMDRAMYVKDGLVQHGGVPVPVELAEACLRVAVAVTFLATGGDKIVECDVLNRDLLRYLDAKKKNDTEKQKRLVDRAKRNRKHGFTVGREITFPGRSGGGGESTGESHELHFQHQRSAHWHWVRYGPGRAKMKLMFFGQTTVRPDLPINPDARRGYKTKH